MRRFILFLALMAVATGAEAFDGDRKGFVLGFGLGFSPWASSSHEYMGESYSESSSGPTGGFRIGYGWNEQNLLTAESEVVSATYGDYRPSERWQGFVGAVWTHYYGPTGGSFFTTLGLGYYRVESDDDPHRYDPEVPGPRPATPAEDGPGLLLGAGYEFAPHWEAGVTMSIGRTTTMDADFSNAHVNVMVKGTLF